jgi:hypothetical protein
MKANPLRLIVAGYSGAAAMAGVAGALGAGWPVMFAGIWLGGAIMTVMLAAVAPPGGWLRPAESLEDEDHAQAARRWEDDRAADRPVDAAARRSG